MLILIPDHKNRSHFKVAMALDAIEKLAHTAKVPSHYDKVFKDECMFCFCTALSEGGLYINLATFQAFCHHHVTLDQQRSGQALYVRDCAHRVRGCQAS